MAGEGGVVAEECVFGDGLAGAHGLEISPEVRALVVPGIAFVGVALRDWFFTGRGIVFGVPLFHVGFAEIVREAGRVIAGRGIFARLRIIIDGEFGDFENSLRALEAVNFGSVAAEIKAQVHGNFPVFEERGVNVRHVAAIVET